MLEKIWDVLGEILAVMLVVTYALLILNANFSFLTNETLIKVLDILRNYGSLALIGIVGMEAMARRNFILKLIFLAFVAIIVIFLFFPATYANFIGAIA